MSTSAAHAATIHNTFVGSSTGTAGGLVEHDTIQFEVTITGGSFTVVPEPGTGAMPALGLVLIVHGTNRSRRG